MSSSQQLNKTDLAEVIRLTPLVSVDLIVRDAAGRVLLGLRNNEPAKDFYFVPGGRILKGERLRDAFARVLVHEVNVALPYEGATFLGVYEHFYTTNAFAVPDLATHYVVIAFEVRAPDISIVQIDSQHSEYRWMYEHELLAAALVHDNVKAYFGPAKSVPRAAVPSPI